MSEYTDRFGSAKVFNPEPAHGAQPKMSLNWLPSHFRNLSGAPSRNVIPAPRDRGNRPHVQITTDDALGYVGSGQDLRVRTSKDDDCPGCGLCGLPTSTDLVGLRGMAPGDSQTRRDERTAAAVVNTGAYQARKARHPETFADSRIWRNGRGRNSGRVAQRQAGEHGDPEQHMMTPSALLGGRFDRAGGTRSGGTK
jgi:hypothetical protein